MKVRVPPRGSAKEGYHFLPEGWLAKTHRRGVQPCYCRVGWKTGTYPQASAAASTGPVGGAMWACHGVHLENADALKGFYLAQLPFSRTLPRKSRFLGLFFVSAGIYDLWVSLALRLGYTGV